MIFLICLNAIAVFFSALWLFERLFELWWFFNDGRGIERLTVPFLLLILNGALLISNIDKYRHQDKPNATTIKETMPKKIDTAYVITSLSEEI